MIIAKITLNLSLLRCILFANYSRNFQIVMKFGKHYFPVSRQLLRKFQVSKHYSDMTKGEVPQKEVNDLEILLIDATLYIFCDQKLVFNVLIETFFLIYHRDISAVKGSRANLTLTPR